MSDTALDKGKHLKFLIVLIRQTPQQPENMEAQGLAYLSVKD